MGGIQQGDTVVVFGAGPVGLMAARSAWLFGAGRVIVIDHIEYRLDFARTFCPAEIYNFREIDDMVVFLKKQTDSLGADVCIDAVGGDAAGNALQTLIGTKLKLEAGNAIALHWAINSSRKAAWYRSSASTDRRVISSRSATSCTKALPSGPIRHR